MSIIHQETRASHPGKRRTTAPKSPSTRKRRGDSRPRKEKKSSFLRSLSDWPAWAIWTGGILIAFAYLYLFYYFFVGPFSFRWKAIYSDPPYPSGYNIRGIDISHYQNRINWEVLRNSTISNDPVRFIIIKATEGESMMDDDFNENFYQAHENCFIRGAYHFFVPGINARRQAEFFLHQVHLLPGDLPPVLDIEKQGKLSSQELQKDVLTWLDIVEAKYSVKPIIYTSYKFRKDILKDPRFDEYPLWIAHYYVDELEYQGEWKFWQHTDCGKVEGIKGFVDCNIFNGTLPELLQLTIPEQEEEE